MANFLEFRQGKGSRGPNVEAPSGLIAPEAQFQGPDITDLLKDAQAGAAGQLVEMLTQRGVTSDEMREARAYLETHPDLSREYRTEFMAALERVKDMPKEQVVEILENELKIINSPDTSPQELERYKKEGILAPLIIPLQLLQPKIGGDKAREGIRKVAGNKIAKVPRAHAGPRAAYYAAGAAITGTATYFDYTFSKPAVGDIVTALVDKIGVQKAVQLFGQGHYKVYETATNLIGKNSAPLSEIDQAALGQGMITTYVVAALLGYISKRKQDASSPGDLVSRKHPYHAAGFALAAGGLLLAAPSTVDKKIIEAQPSAILGAKVSGNLQSKTAAITAAGKTIEGLPQRIQDPINAAVNQMFNVGKPKTGRLTAAAWLALEGDVKDSSGKTIRERYMADMAVNGVVAPKDIEMFDAILEATNNINTSEKYSNLGLKAGNGAKNLVQILTAPLPAQAQALDAYFKSMLVIAKKKEQVTLRSAVLGDINPLDEEFWKHQPSFAEIYALQANYPAQVVTLMRKVAGLKVISEYISDIEKDLKTGAKTKLVKLDIRVPIDIPSLGFTESEIMNLVVPKKGEGFDFENALNRSKSEVVWNMIWGTPEAWKMREALVKRDLIDNKMSENLSSKLAYKGGIYSVFIFLLVASVIFSGTFAKKRERIDEENLDQDADNLHAKENELVEGVVNYVEAFTSDVIGTLRHEGSQVTASTVINDAFRMHVAFVLRRKVLQETPDPRERGKNMSESPDGIAFMNQTSKRFSPEDVEYSQKIRDAYVKRLNQWMDSLKADPFGTIESLLVDVDPQFRPTADALVRLNAANPGNVEREQALSDLNRVFDIREKSIISAEATRLALSVARLEAREEAVRGMVGDADDVVVYLDGSDPGLTKQNIIASYILSDIEAETYALRATIEGLQEKGATVTPPDPEQAHLTEEDWFRERDAFLARERTGLVQGTDITGNEDQVVSQLNSFVGAISQGIQPIKNELLTRLRAINPSATISFEYGYNHARRGPTITATYGDSRNPSEFISLPYARKVPSADENSSAKVIDSIRDWAKPDGVLEQRLRVNALYGANRGEFISALQTLQSLSPSLQFDRDTAVQNAATIDTLMRAGNILRIQKPLIEELIADKALSPEDIRLFTNPQSIPGIWRGSFTDALERAMRSRFANMTDKKIIVAFDKNNIGYIAAVPIDANLPVDIAALPDRDKISVLRASQS